MIRKRPLADTTIAHGHQLDLAKISSFEVTSEDSEFPLEGILNGWGWRAAEDGPQTIRLTFDTPQKISRITLLFEERAQARTQEFALSWQSSEQGVWHEFRRQQFNFSPPSTTTERETYEASFEGVTALSLHIIPAISGAGRATLAQFIVE